MTDTNTTELTGTNDTLTPAEYAHQKRLEEIATLRRRVEDAFIEPEINPDKEKEAVDAYIRSISWPLRNHRTDWWDTKTIASFQLPHPSKRDAAKNILDDKLVDAQRMTETQIDRVTRNLEILDGETAEITINGLNDYLNAPGIITLNFTARYTPRHDPDSTLELTRRHPLPSQVTKQVYTTAMQLAGDLGLDVDLGLGDPHTSDDPGL